MIDHPHPQWLGSDMACEICNPICYGNHGFGKGMAFKACDNPKCPNRLDEERLHDRQELNDVLDTYWKKWKDENDFNHVVDKSYDERTCYLNNLCSLCI